jgi:hypothetical protein
MANTVRLTGNISQALNMTGQRSLLIFPAFEQSSELRTVLALFMNTPEVTAADQRSMGLQDHQDHLLVLMSQVISAHRQEVQM